MVLRDIGMFLLLVGYLLVAMRLLVRNLRVTHRAYRQVNKSRWLWMALIGLFLTVDICVALFWPVLGAMITLWGALKSCYAWITKP